MQEQEAQLDSSDLALYSDVGRLNSKLIIEDSSIYTS
jgi:hypothetical protein